jgi:hypothetical protein
MPGTFSNIVVHVVFSTKNRLPLLTASTRGILFPYVEGIVKRVGGSLIDIGGPQGADSKRKTTVKV